MRSKQKSTVQRIGSVAKPTLSLVISVGLMAFIFSHVEWAVLRQSLQMMSPSVLAAAFILLLFNDFFLCFKCFLLRPDLPFWRVYCAFLNMRFFSLLPGGNATGEAARLMSLREMTDTQTAAAMILIDKQTHMIPAQVFCLLAMLASSIHIPSLLVWMAVWSLVWPLIAPGVLFIPAVRRFTRRVGQRLRRWKLGRVVDDQLAVLCKFCETLAKHPRQLGAHLLCGFIGEGCGIATMILLSSQLAFPVPWWDWLWLNSIMLLAMVLPLSTMGMGVREAAMVLLLSLYGIGESQAMSLPLIISALSLVKGIIGGVVAVIDRRARLHSRPSMVK